MTAAPKETQDQLPVDADALEQKEAVRKWVEDRRASDRLPPAPVAEELSNESECETCSGNGWIGGPSYARPDEGGEPCPECNHQLSAPVAEEKGESVSRPVYQLYSRLAGAWDDVDQDEYERQTHYKRRCLYTHPQPAIDVDALAEFLEVSDFFGFSPAVARDLAMRICNWIEEQKQ